MDVENKHFFWGMLLGAAVAALAGAVALARSFHTSPLAGGAAEIPGKKRTERRTAANKSKARR